MTPHEFYNNSLRFHVYNSGQIFYTDLFTSESEYLEYDRVNHENYYRPVINLKANVIFNGSGTMEDPYHINE